MVLSDINQRYLLATTPIYWLLSPDDYQLFITDTLPVKKEEFRDALKWRARSLLSYPVEEAMLDYFTLPAKKGTTGPMLALTAVKADLISKVVRVIKKSGLNLTMIYIPELALRNLSSLYETDEKSTGVIYFYNNGAILNITSQKTLYFSRRLNWTSATAALPNNAEQVCLDIMRYFDFFQTQWRMPGPSRIFVAAEEKSVDEIASALSQHLTISVQPFDLKIPDEGNKPEQVIGNPFLLPYGCALCEEKEYVSPGN
jgi:MSHA biogenesis protein MshI